MDFLCKFLFWIGDASLSAVRDATQRIQPVQPAAVAE
jgi:hypothetical protein